MQWLVHQLHSSIAPGKRDGCDSCLERASENRFVESWIIEHRELDRKRARRVIPNVWLVGQAFDAKRVTCGTGSSENALVGSISARTWIIHVSNRVLGTKWKFYLQGRCEDVSERLSTLILLKQQKSVSLS